MFQLRQRSIAIACFQETRQNKSGIIEHDFYFEISSLSDKGRFGCSIFVSKVIPFFQGSGGRKVRIASKDIMILHSDP
eukprot:12113708-Karenia_brevis.AAC.1